VFLASLALFILGGEVLRGFSFIMTVGVVVGTYSSVFVAASFALLWENMMQKRRAAATPPRAPEGEKRREARPAGGGPKAGERKVSAAGQRR